MKSSLFRVLVVSLCSVMFVFGLGAGIWWERATASVNTPVLATGVPKRLAVTVTEQRNSDEKLVPNPLAVARAEGISQVRVAGQERLLALLHDLEGRVTRLESALEAEPQTEDEVDGETSLMESLSSAGFVEESASWIVDWRDRQQLKRLELRDQATREGWLDSEEFRAAIRSMGDGALRVELGDQQYDRYLYAVGLNNRVVVADVLATGAGDRAGVEAGDSIISYAGERIFQIGEVQQHTRAGVKGEYVSLIVERDGELLEFIMERGPIGVSIQGTVQAPQDG